MYIHVCDIYRHLGHVDDEQVLKEEQAKDHTK